MRYKAVFFDIDDTLLDYVPCCREAFEAAMEGYDVNDELFQLFFSISGRLFSEAKHGLHTVAEVMELYPAEFIDRIRELYPQSFCNGQTAGEMTDSFKHAFRAAWGRTHTLVPGAKECLERLKKQGYRLFAASNSFGELQRRRLDRAGILTFFEQTFISMDIGYDKPDLRFFTHALKAVNAAEKAGPLLPEEILMIGDSMTSDIIGAKEAGWNTCFFNRRAEDVPDRKAVDFEIRSLEELTRYL